MSDRGRLPSTLLSEFRAEKEEEAKKQLPQMPVKRNHPPAQPAKRVMAGKVEKKGTPAKPKCPIHSGEMEHSSVLGMWSCTEKGCKQRAWPKDGATKPAVGTGKVSLIRERVGKGRFYLRASNGVLLDITDAATDITVNTERGYTTATVELVLHLE